MKQLRSLAKERNLRGYSRLRKADLINFLCKNKPINASINSNGDEIKQPIEQPIEQHLTKRQLKRRRNKASKLSKKSKNLKIEIDDLKSHMDDLEDKINKVSSSAGSRFKQKKIRSMKREAVKLAEKIQERTNKLKTIEVQLILQSSQLSKANKTIKKKIEDLNRRIRRVRGGNKGKNKLIAKRDALKLQLVNINPRLIEGAFGGAYAKYRIDGVEGRDLPTFFEKTKNTISTILRKETA